MFSEVLKEDVSLCGLIAFPVVSLISLELVSEKVISLNILKMFLIQLLCFFYERSKVFQAATDFYDFNAAAIAIAKLTITLKELQGSTKNIRTTSKKQVHRVLIFSQVIVKT